MRPRTTGISATARSQQQPSQALTFKPKSEWKHENEFSVLFLYLPGFTMEQLTITPDYSKRTVNVEGKRRLPNNRLLPVNETFNVPEDCEFIKLDKQFGKGILMLKFPKKSPQYTKVITEDEEPVTVKNDQERTRINDIEASVDENSVTEVAKTDEEKKDHIGGGNGKQADESDIKNVKEVESKEQWKESSSTTLYTKRGDESGDANASSETKEVMNGDSKSIMNMLAAVVVIMGLGVSLFYTIVHKLIS